MTNEEAAIAIRAHHSELRAGLAGRVNALAGSVRRGSRHAEAQRIVVDYLDTEVLPHARAEEETLYSAADAGLTALLVRSMRAEHDMLTRHVESLRAETDAVGAAITAGAIRALFEAHLFKENELLVPALADDPQVNLSTLLAGMHELVG